jgi:F-type H+-transporting ATPase subunit gamma
MPNLIDLRRRIRSVKNTEQITKAMKMVSAAKLRRAQDQVLSARPYSTLLREMLGSILGNLPEGSPAFEHPLLARREEKRVLTILVTADKGLCGAFNTNVIKGAQQFLRQRADASVEVEFVGRKGRDFFKTRDVAKAGEWINILAKVEFSIAEEIANKAMERFEKEEIDAVYLIFNEFKSVMSQKLSVERLLPIGVPETAGQGGADYIYAQPADQIFRSLLPRYVKVGIFQAMLESVASEHAARMTAMESATKNAGEMIEKLTLHLNRVRQASITTELIEVVSGAAALE